MTKKKQKRRVCTKKRIGMKDIVFHKENVIAMDKNNKVYILDKKKEDVYKDILVRMSKAMRLIKKEIEGLLDDSVDIKITYHIRPKP